MNFHKFLVTQPRIDRKDNKKDIRRKIVNYLMGTIIIAPPILLVIIEFVVPFFTSLITSFMIEGKFSLENYKVVAHLYLGDIFYTIFISVTSLIVVLIIAIGVGGLLSLRTNRVIEFLFKIPLFVPFVVVGHAMGVFLAPRGILNLILSQVGIVNIDNPPEFTGGTAGIIIALSWKQMAFAILLIMGAFRSVDKSFLEAAKNFGASTFRQIKDMLIPLSLPSIGVAAILIFTSFLQNFSTVMMMAKGDGPHHLMVDVYQEITYLNRLGVANALGTVSYILALGAALYYLKKVLKKND